MNAFFVALQFLTIWPIGIKSKVEKETFGRSLAWFPFVGLLLGLVLSLSIFLFGILPQMVIAAIIVGASIILTGGIHIDGFADTCDGLYGFTSKEKALGIMRDSHVGAMAVMGITTLLILKFSLLAGIPQGLMWKYLILMAVFARWSQALSCFLSDYARDEGKAKYFIEYADLRGLLIGGIFTLALFVFLLKTQGLALFFAGLVFVSILIKYIKGKIGGMTGDTVGAINEITEVAVLLFGAVLWRVVP